jgi:hypothetical protein
MWIHQSAGNNGMKLIPARNPPGTRNGTILLTSSWYRPVVLQFCQGRLCSRLVEDMELQVWSNRMTCRFIWTPCSSHLSHTHVCFLLYVATIANGISLWAGGKKHTGVLKTETWLRKIPKLITRIPRSRVSHGTLMVTYDYVIINVQKGITVQREAV